MPSPATLVDRGDYLPSAPVEHVYLTQVEYLEYYAVKLPVVPGFEFGRLPYSVYRRFIELLPAFCSHFFMKTSKSNYYNSFDLRGIECSELSDLHPGFNEGKLKYPSGKLCISIHTLRYQWQQYIVINDSFTVYASEFHPISLHCVQKYRKLTVENGSKILEYTQYFAHPKLEEFELRVGMGIHYTTTTEILTERMIPDVQAFCNGHRNSPLTCVIRINGHHLVHHGGAIKLAVSKNDDATWELVKEFDFKSLSYSQSNNYFDLMDVE